MHGEASADRKRAERWLVLLAVALAATVSGQEGASRGLKPLTISDGSGRSVVSFSEHHALIIGNSAYRGGWDPLPGVKQDIEAVKRCLEEQDFRVQVRTDLTKQQLADALDEFIEECAMREDARVVIYYAGHGYTRDRVGYLVGIDAPVPSEKGFIRSAYEIAAIKIKAQQAKARHVLFAFDACFAGSVFVPMRGAKEYVLAAAREPVRMFLTSGSADETVPDQSFFCQEFVAGINGAADMNHDGYVTGSELATYIKQTVRDRAAAAGIKLTPQAGVSEQEGLNRGDIVFVSKRGAASADRPPSPATAVAPAAAAAPSASAPPPAAPAATNSSTFDLERIRREAEAERQRVQNKLREMRDAAMQIELLDTDDRLVLRKAWEQFLAVYAEDLAGTNDDDRLRDKARKRLAELSTAPAAPPASSTTPKTEAPAAAAKPAVQTTPALSAEQVYRQLVGSYRIEEVDGQRDDSLRFFAVIFDDEQRGLLTNRPRRVRIVNDATRQRNPLRVPECDLEVQSLRLDGDVLEIKGSIATFRVRASVNGMTLEVDGRRLVLSSMATAHSTENPTPGSATAEDTFRRLVGTYRIISVDDRDDESLRFFAVIFEDEKRGLIGDRPRRVRIVNDATRKRNPLQVPECDLLVHSLRLDGETLEIKGSIGTFRVRSSVHGVHMEVDERRFVLQRQ
ncbi:MAG: caspase family protein [Planctomycetota bacterium]|nr:caspase family protein [Planctomycetota bacterium]MDW8373298.1 caspase family protein [Planctomycetota bacterium]